MKRYFTLITSVCILVLATIAVVFWPKNSQPTVVVDGQKILVEIADAEDERAKGLCCRKSLDKNHGMLFVYDKPGDYRFWMKDTLIPLDIIWIDQNKKIVHIEHSVEPSSYPKAFGSDKLAQYVLEVNSGYVKQHSINIGDNVNF